MYHISIADVLPRIEIHSVNSLPSILGHTYGLYSNNNGTYPTYIQLSTSNVVYLRYDEGYNKWVFSSRLTGGTLYASTLSISSETYPQSVSQNWTVHSDNSILQIQFSPSGKTKAIKCVSFSNTCIRNFKTFY